MIPVMLHTFIIGKVVFTSNLTTMFPNLLLVTTYLLRKIIKRKGKRSYTQACKRDLSASLVDVPPSLPDSMNTLILDWQKSEKTPQWPQLGLCKTAPQHTDCYTRIFYILILKLFIWHIDRQLVEQIGNPGKHIHF